MTSSRYPWKPKLRLAVRIGQTNIVSELTFWRPNICLKWPGFQISAFAAPISEHYVHAWKQKSRFYSGGYILRVLWLGFCLRYGAVKVPRKKTFEQLFGDYVPDDAIDFETDRLIALDGLASEADLY